MAANMTKEMLYQELRRRIITMDLPPGADLDEAELSAAYGMSRTPVRETLIRLQSDGLVVQRRNRGASVAPLDMGTLQSWFEAGRMVHRAVVRLACLRRRDEDLAAIRAAMEEFEQVMAAEDLLGMIHANERFHDCIGLAARNPYLYASYQRILADHERISRLCYGHEIEYEEEADKQLTLQQHRDLYAAIAERDADTAERVIDAHLNLCKDGLRRILEGSEHVLADVALDEA
ncbi:MAG: GntR family transcriptional regulator [Halofilum sp. (in: g-proteobacteria)]|nr:GntR family transcriptional regulator [Halofilum sp. (in: g-proteobacteria)]